MPGGRLIFDVFNPQVSFLAEDPQRHYERARYDDPEGSGEIVIEETREYIAARQIVRSTRYYHLGSERNKWIGTADCHLFSITLSTFSGSLALSAGEACWV